MLCYSFRSVEDKNHGSKGKNGEGDFLSPLNFHSYQSSNEKMAL